MQYAVLSAYFASVPKVQRMHMLIWYESCCVKTHAQNRQLKPLWPNNIYCWQQLWCAKTGLLLGTIQKSHCIALFVYCVCVRHVCLCVCGCYSLTPIGNILWVTNIANCSSFTVCWRKQHIFLICWHRAQCDMWLVTCVCFYTEKISCYG